MKASISLLCIVGLSTLACDVEAACLLMRRPVQEHLAKVIKLVGLTLKIALHLRCIICLFVFSHNAYML